MRRRRNPIEYLFKATFSGKDVSAPLPSPLLCDVGSLTITDTEDKLSISGGELVCAGGKAAPAWGDPGVWSTDSFARVCGKVVILSFNISVFGANALLCGFADAQSGAPVTNVLQFDGSGTRVWDSSGSGLAVEGALSVSTDYQMAVILRGAGMLALIKGGAYSQWTVIWAGNVSTTSPLYAAFSGWNPVYNGDNLRVIDLGGAWASDYGIARVHVASPGAITPTLGSELVTNGNMETGDPPTGWTANASILDGVADERTGGAGAQSLSVTNSGAAVGGAYRNVTVALGTWYCLSSWLKKITAVEGRVTLADTAWSNIISILSGSVSWTGKVAAGRCAQNAGAGHINCYNNDAVAAREGRFDDTSVKPITLSTTLGTVYDKHADYLAEVGVTLTAGTQCGMMLNINDESNPTDFLLAFHDGTNAHLEKCVGGTYTSLISSAAAYTAGKRLVVVKDGTSVTLYYNEAKIGATQTINDAGIKDNTKHTWFSTYSGNAFSDFVLWPRTVTLPQGV